MNSPHSSSIRTGLLAGLLLIFALAGCTTTPKIDWNSRVGSYTYDQAVIDYGPPDKSAKLSDQSMVVEWLTQKGGYQSYGHGMASYGHPYRPYGYYPGYVYAPYDVSRTPDRHLRLVFDPEGKLKGWNLFSR